MNRMNKRGVDIWVSWVLITAFAVVLGTMMYYWMTSYTQGTTTDMTNRVSTEQGCDAVAISIDSACKNAQHLYINLTNRKDRTVDNIIVRAFNTTTSDLAVNETNLTLRPGKTKEINVTVSISNTNYVEVVPGSIDGELVFSCPDKKATANVATC